MNISEVIENYEQIFLVEQGKTDDCIDKIIWYCKEVDKKILFTDDCTIFELYKRYNFSDKVKCLSPSVQYGNIFNYIKTGILTIEEAIEVLVY